MSKWITIRLSPDAKHALKWVHTWLGIAAASAPLLYEHLDALQGFINQRALNYITALLVVMMVANTIRKKG